MLKRFMTVCTVVFITACKGLPDNVDPVRNFDPERYLGKWYEVARLDSDFERDR